MGLIFLFVVFFLMGTIFLVIVKVCENYYKGMYKRCTATIEGIPSGNSRRKEDPENMKNITHEYYPLYKYVVNGHEYYCKGVIGNYNPNGVEFKNEIVHYNPNDPEESYVDMESSIKY